MKQKSILSTLVLLLSMGTLFAQDPPQLKDHFVMTPDFVNPYKAESDNWIPKTNGTVTFHSFDALHYKLELDWYQNYTSPYNHDYKAVETFKFLVDSTLNSIQLHANDSSIVVDSVKLAGISFLQYNGILSINLNATYNPGDTVSLKIYYAHRNYVDFAFLAKNGFAFTDCSPEKARNWFPCWDRPFDKATFETVVKTKLDVELCSNGALVDTTTIGDTLIYHWKSRDPIATYIMANISNLNFIKITDYWKKPSNLNDSIPVMYYYNVGEEVDSLRYYMKDMMNFFSLLYGEYPFEKLAWAALNSDFPWSGMENQTIISLYPNGWNDKNTTVHEFAHHWFGDLVTHATWADIFVKEGFPQYSVALYFEHLYGRPGYLGKVLEFSNYYLQYNPQWAIHNPAWASTIPATATLFDYAITYCKSATVLHSLRGVVGDSAFFAILKSYATDPAFMFKTATVEDFIQKTNTITGNDYSWFFTEWLDNANHPIYNNNYVVTDNGATWTVDYTISQTQTNAPFFKMPVEVEVTFTDHTDTIVRVMNDQNDQTFAFTFNKEPQTISFDPLVKILPKVEIAPSKCSGLKTFTAISDTIDDGSGVGNYGNNSNCYWNITPSNSPAAIQLHFIDFDTEADSDTLIVFDNQVSPALRIAKFSGKNIPADMVCNTSKIRLKFVTNKYVTRQGWSVCYSPTTGVDNMGNIAQYSIFPNPVSDLVMVQIALENNDNVAFVITDLLGRIVFSVSDYVMGTLEKKIDLSEFKNGVYLLNIKTSKGSVQRKIIKNQ